MRFTVRSRKKRSTMFSQEEPVGTKWMRSVTGVFATGEYSPSDFLPLSSILHTKALSIPLRGGACEILGRQAANGEFAEHRSRTIGSLPSACIASEGLVATD